MLTHEEALDAVEELGQRLDQAKELVGDLLEQVERLDAENDQLNDERLRLIDEVTSLASVIDDHIHSEWDGLEAA